MTYWADDRAIDMEQRRLDAEQARAKRAMEAAEAEELPRCDCGHLFEICHAPNCPAGDDPNH